MVSSFILYTLTHVGSGEGCESTVLVLDSPTNGAALGTLSELVLLLDDLAAGTAVTPSTAALPFVSPAAVSVTVSPGSSASFTVTVTRPPASFPAPQQLLEVVLLLDHSSSAQTLLQSFSTRFPDALATLYALSSNLRVGVAKFVDEASTGAGAAPYTLLQPLTSRLGVALTAVQVCGVLTTLSVCQSVSQSFFLSLRRCSNTVGGGCIPLRCFQQPNW